jgi:hypothetical protein
VLGDRVFVQTIELAQLKFKLGVARSLHFPELIPNRSKLFLPPVRDRHARNRLSLTADAAVRFNPPVALACEDNRSSHRPGASEQKTEVRLSCKARTPRGEARRWPMMRM